MAVVQIQNRAPVELLIGTDLLSSLGVLFLLREPKVGQCQAQYDLLQKTTWNLQADEFVLATKETNRWETSRMTGMKESTTATGHNSQDKECVLAKELDTVKNKTAV